MPAVRRAGTGRGRLRATGRIYLGLGPDPGDEAEAPSAEDQEKADRPLALMLAPALVLLLLALLPAQWVEDAAPSAARLFAGKAATLSLSGASGSASALLPWVSTVLALVMAAWALGRAHWPKGLIVTTDAVTRPVFRKLDAFHSGLVGDYVAWMMVGLASFAASAALRS